MGQTASTVSLRPSAAAALNERFPSLRSEATDTALYNLSSKDNCDTVVWLSPVVREITNQFLLF